MRLPNTFLWKFIGYKWLLWRNLGVKQFQESGTLQAHYHTVHPKRKVSQNYQSPKNPANPQVFCPLAFAFLLSYLGVYFFLGCFNPLLGCYCLFEELFHLKMMYLPVGSLVTGLNHSTIIHHLGRLLSSGWVPDNLSIQSLSETTRNSPSRNQILTISQQTSS
ncbi:hypothetical protein DSO57_1003341 [Entomophthora muscae]|uniref:Uncharacterized protein n=1 Tax=Entomophthora muscae TaxID=34485 RepID=A0ACC2U6C9_9FUNG|nr:hypothetical protein DSO57_1003341 [Entomophthora muscae]